MTGIISDNVGRPSGLIKAASGGGGTWTLIKTLTASADATLSFVDGTDDVVLDSTYPIYLFKWINIHPATDSTHFSFNGRDGGTNYDATKTTSHFEALHYEGDSSATLQYNTAGDLAQSTGVQSLGRGVGNDNDQATSGELWLFSPSSTTFVKHFMHTDSVAHDGNANWHNHVAGYFNVTAAIDGIQFSMSSGNIDLGKIKLYGLSDS